MAEPRGFFSIPKIVRCKIGSKDPIGNRARAIAYDSIRANRARSSERSRRVTVVKIMNRRLDAIGGLAALLGLAVLVPSLIALAVAIIAVIIAIL